MKIEKRLIQNILETKIRNELLKDGSFLNESLSDDYFMSKGSPLTQMGLTMSEEEQEEFLSLLRLAGRKQSHVNKKGRIQGGDTPGTSDIKNAARDSQGVENQTPDQVYVMRAFIKDAPNFLTKIADAMSKSEPILKGEPGDFFSKTIGKASDTFKNTFYGKHFQVWQDIAEQFEKSKDSKERDKFYSRIKNDLAFINGALNYEKFEPEIYRLNNPQQPQQPPSAPNAPNSSVAPKGGNPTNPNMGNPGNPKSPGVSGTKNNSTINQKPPTQSAPIPPEEKPKEDEDPDYGPVLKKFTPDKPTERLFPIFLELLVSVGSTASYKDLKKRYANGKELEGNFFRKTIAYMRAEGYLNLTKDNNGNLIFNVTDSGKRKNQEIRNSKKG